MISRSVNGQNHELGYDAENRLVSVSGAATTSFSYGADGRQIIGTVNGVTTYYGWNHYEVMNDVVTKYPRSARVSSPRRPLTAGLRVSHILHPVDSTSDL